MRTTPVTTLVNHDHHHDGRSDSDVWKVVERTPDASRQKRETSPHVSSDRIMMMTMRKGETREKKRVTRRKKSRQRRWETEGGETRLDAGL